MVACRLVMLTMMVMNLIKWCAGEPPPVKEICLDMGQPLHLHFADKSDAAVGPRVNMKEALLHIAQCKCTFGSRSNCHCAVDYVGRSQVV